MGTMLDLLTCANTVPVMGNPWVSATCSHTHTLASMSSFPYFCHLTHTLSRPTPSCLCHFKPAISSPLSHPHLPLPCATKPAPSRDHHPKQAQAHTLSHPALSHPCHLKPAVL